MKSKILVLIIVILDSANGQFSCSDIEKDIYPCTCLRHVNYRRDVSCLGKDVKDLSLLLKNRLVSPSGEVIIFDLLTINDTSITRIEAGTFGDAHFNAIRITNNLRLTRIESKAFKKSERNVQTLHVLNSPILVEAEGLFNLASDQRVSYDIRFQNLGIKEIPDNAFAYNPFSLDIVIMNNPISRIGKFAFHQLPNLRRLVLVNNTISQIDSNGLTFDLWSGFEKSLLTVYLDNNQITEKSFNEKWSEDTHGHRSLHLTLQANYMRTLPKNLFYNILKLTSLERIYFGGNDFRCDCHMSYLLQMKEKIINKLQGVCCININFRDIWSISSAELGNCI